MYLNESYIHEHYKKDADSVWDPNDNQDLQVGKLPNKGNRYCFLCAIQGPNPRVFDYSDIVKDEEARLMDKLTLVDLIPTDRGGVVEKSVWSFSPQQKKMHKGNYHKVFNSANFLQWWRDQLLPNLHQPSLVIMDNAKYHCTWPEDVPKLRAKKQVFAEYLQSRNIPVANTDTVEILKGKVMAQRSKEKFQCELLAEAKGHKVLFTPPCHSDLQPIELLWAKLKGNIGQKYDSSTTMTVLKQRLDEEFVAALGWNESIEGMIHRTSRLAAKFYASALADNGDPGEAKDGSDSSDNESDEENDDEEEGDFVAV